MDSRRGASDGVVGSTKAVCGVRIATLPSWTESKLWGRVTPSTNGKIPVILLNHSPLNQDCLVWTHVTEIFPFVVRVVANVHNLAVSVRVLKSGGDKIVLRVDAPVITER